MKIIIAKECMNQPNICRMLSHQHEKVFYITALLHHIKAASKNYHKENTRGMNRYYSS